MRTQLQLFKTTMLAIATIGLASTASGQEDKAITDLTTRVDSFFDHLADEMVDAQKAFNELLEGSPLQGQEDVKKLIDRVGKLEGMYGRFLEAERVDAKLIGKDVVLLKYLYKTERYPLVWYFTYYRAPSTTGVPAPWVIITVRFDTRVELLGL